MTIFVIALNFYLGSIKKWWLLLRIQLYLTKFKETTKTQVEEAVKNYKRKQSTVLKQPEINPSTISMQLLPIEASQKRNNLSSNDNVGITMNKLLNNNNKDLDWIQWSPSILTN